MKMNFSAPGIPDEAFVRRPGIPMTKQEVRVISLAKLQLFPGAVVYDIGAGTGSVAIECRLLIGDGQVFAIESNPEAVELIKLNCFRFKVQLDLIPGSAPEAIKSLPAADRIFVGGSGGEIEAMLLACDQKLKAGGIMVLNSVTLYTAPAACQTLEELGYDVQAVQVNVAVNELRGRARIWQARNPVTIICGKKGEQL